MVSPVLTLLVASSIQMASEGPRRADLAGIVLELTQAIVVSGRPEPETRTEPTVCDIPFYYDDLLPVAPPAAATPITYDWRSPVIFDLP